MYGQAKHHARAGIEENHPVSATSFCFCLQGVGGNLLAKGWQGRYIFIDRA
jgi:hypothetical protein